jgi:hypothetical protein
MVSKPQTKNLKIKAFARCPLCFHLINVKSLTDAVLVGARNCTLCGILVEKQQIISSCERYLKKTKGLRVGGKILDINSALFVIFTMILVGIALVYFTESTPGILFWVVLTVSGGYLINGLILTLNWLSEYGLSKSTEIDFINVREKISRSRKIWLAANIINLCLWFVYIKFL